MTDGLTIAAISVFGIAGGMLVFLILRYVVLWYWRVNEIVENQKKIIELLATHLSTRGR